MSYLPIMHKVLVIDDNKDISEMIQFLLLKKDIDVQINTTGLNVFEDVFDFKPDLILMDIALPEKLGSDICRELKRTHTMPIILVSAFNKDEKMLRECEANGFIQKPFHLKELLDTVSSHLVPGKSFF